MLGRPISLAVYCALGASAFLLPPSATLDNDDGSSIFSVFEVDPKHQILELPCSSCAFPYKDAANEVDEDANDDGMFWAQGGARNLVLNFTISNDGQGLLVNEHYIYPFEKLVENKNMMEDMYIDQVPASTTTAQIHDQEPYQRASLQVTGSGLSEEETVQADDNDLITLNWQLLSLEHQAMTVDSIYIQLLRTNTGELLILSIDTKPSMGDNNLLFPDESFGLPSHHPDLSTKPHGKPCTLPGPFCAISDFVGSTFGSHGRPCPGRKFGGDHLPTHIRPHFGRPHADEYKDSSEPWSAGPPSRHFDHSPHHGHRHGHHRHGFFHVVSHGILAVLIPIMAGITVGIVVSVTGLLFGRFLGWLWFTVFRGGRRGYTSVALEEEHIGERKEVTVSEEEEALPMYEDAPPYENRGTNTTT